MSREIRQKKAAEFVQENFKRKSEALKRDCDNLQMKNDELLFSLDQLNKVIDELKDENKFLEKEIANLK